MNPNFAIEAMLPHRLDAGCQALDRHGEAPPLRLAYYPILLVRFFTGHPILRFQPCEFLACGKNSEPSFFGMSAQTVPPDYQPFYRGKLNSSTKISPMLQAVSRGEQWFFVAASRELCRHDLAVFAPLRVPFCWGAFAVFVSAPCRFPALFVRPASRFSRQVFPLYLHTTC